MGLVMDRKAICANDSLGDALAGLRPADAICPPMAILDREPVLAELPRQMSLSDWAATPEVSSKARDLKVAVDLDDTLLHNSHTCPALWDYGGYHATDIKPGYVYDEMRSSAIGRLRMLRGRARYNTIDLNNHAYMAAPRVIVSPNFALISLLGALHAAGTQLTLATASARLRVDLLFDRLPFMRDIFGTSVFCAEDLAARSRDAAQDRIPESSIWAKSAQAHALRENSLFAKTPWALSPGFDGQPYDFLIDDSVATAELFKNCGLANKLIKIQGNATGPEETNNTAIFCAQHLLGTDSPRPPLSQVPILRFEDPLYWPLLHIRDQFKLDAPNG